MASRAKAPNKHRQPCVLCEVIVEVETGVFYTFGQGDWEVLHHKCERKLAKLKTIMALLP